MPESSLEDRAKRIKLLAMDVDGVLTDGTIVLDECGGELKLFNAKDGAGLKMLSRTGIPSVIITGRSSGVVKKRAKECSVTEVHMNVLKKLPLYRKMADTFNVTDEQICYIGDDLPDLPVLRAVGLAVSVPSGAEEVKEVCHYITQNDGGHGAVREVIEIILKAQDKWSQVTQRYYEE